MRTKYNFKFEKKKTDIPLWISRLRIVQTEQFKYLVVTCRHIAKLLPRPHPQQPPLV